MVFWNRICRSKLKQVTQQVERYYIQVPTLSYTTANTRVYAVKKPPWSSGRRPTDFCYNLRYFAAPSQGQWKKEDKDASGPRLNEKITALRVRLVKDQEHQVVSIHQALEIARNRKLDLVEVDRNANPPVCKIMDYHKERYEKEAMLKDRAKSKAEVTLKKGGCKEVRFSGKIEQKDLKMKADTVTRLTDRGYRVKCMALPVSKKEEGEDLGGYLSRLLALIEDTTIIESGPHVERKQAYVIIRHVKFGPKKGGGKKPKVVADTDPKVYKDDTDIEATPVEPAILNTHTKDEILASNFSNPKSEPSITAENRYRRSGPTNQSPPVTPMDNQNMGIRDSARSDPQIINQRRQSPLGGNASPSMAENKQVGSDLRNSRPSNNMPKREIPTRSSFGIFSTTKRDTPATNPGTSGVGGNENNQGNQRSGTEKGREKKFGIFSK